MAQPRRGVYRRSLLPDPGDGRRPQRQAGRGTRRPVPGLVAGAIRRDRCLRAGQRPPYKEIARDDP